MADSPSPLRTTGYLSPQDLLAQSSVMEVTKEVAGQPVLSEPAVSDDVKKKDESLTPAERWQKNIAAAGLTEDQANAILDETLTNGYYQRAYPLFRGRLSVTLRTRDLYALQRSANAIDKLRNPLDITVSQIMYRLNLAASISKWGPPGKEIILEQPPLNADVALVEKAFQARLDFIDKAIGAPLVPSVYDCLTHFDKITAAAFSEGASENF
jgi:hypothetical protein